MSKIKNYVNKIHNSTKRDYFERMANSKVKCMKEARKFEKNFFDGNRKFGYGGHYYIPNYWQPVAKKLIKDYNLKDNSSVLDVGCGKGYLLYEIKKINPKINIIGFDISKYAIKNSHPQIKKYLFNHNAKDKFKFRSNQFDLTISLATLHNLKIYDIINSLKEIKRVSKKQYTMIESYRNEKELFNLQCWALTCESFLDIKEWEWTFKMANYTGDYEFIFMN